MYILYLSQMDLENVLSFPSSFSLTFFSQEFNCFHLYQYMEILKGIF